MLLAIYLFCAGLGIPLVALFALGGGDSEIDAGGMEIDAGGGFDADIEIDSGGGFDAVGDFTGIFKNIPVSSYAMFLAFFGGVGAVSTWVGVGTITSLILAVVLGITAGAFNAALFGLLRSSSSDSSLSDRQLEGRVATVSVPIEPGKRGRVWLDTGVERVQITAGSADSDQAQFGLGEKVIIIEMQSGIANVVAIDPDLAD